MKNDNQIEMTELPVKMNSIKINRPVRKLKKKIIRNNEKPIQKYRFIIQIAFISLCIWIGVDFYLFLKTGFVHPAHPAGIFIFLSIILMSLVFGKSFCSWLCPIGTISELIGDFGEKMMKRISQ